ncbi:MAG TPA: ImmA/IrrE family metallo-endopeptidase [Solirubrobacteraceae bacterium]|nr:ImmA/IrrE family metallo-endopeptidase [Solirubrobacteraceae bacterium]
MGPPVTDDLSFSQLMLSADRDAQQILERVWIAGPELDDVKLPVDPFHIARELGLQVYTDRSLAADVSGMLVKRAGYDDPEILLNAGDSRNRQRFTCAHELGHYTKRTQTGDEGPWEYVDRRDTLSTQGKNADEIYANQFAAALLMPAETVRRRAQGSVVATALAFEFGVSADAMTFRLKNLGLL